MEGPYQTQEIIDAKLHGQVEREGCGWMPSVAGVVGEISGTQVENVGVSYSRLRDGWWRTARQAMSGTCEGDGTSIRTAPGASV